MAILKELVSQLTFSKQDGIKEQIEFLKENKQQGISAGIMMESFLRGIRDLGYKSNSYAMNELIDNGIQAGATEINVLMPHKKNHITDIILTDNGHGMSGDMLSVSVAWGGTHRQGSKTGWGKYGYGLPSSCVSMGQKYTIYSKVSDKDAEDSNIDKGWHTITVDLKSALSDEEFNPQKVFSEVTKIEVLPEDITDELLLKNIDVKSFQSGTIIHITNLDKVKYQHPTTKENFIEDFGTTYYDMFPQVKIKVDGDLVEGIDPCFATPGLKYYHSKENNVSGGTEHYTIQQIPIKAADTGEEAMITIRMNLVPADFATLPGKATAVTSGSSELANRFRFLKNNNGIVFKRLKRRIDCISKTPLHTFTNNNRYMRIEIDFPPMLDANFEMNTSKQNAIPDQKFWDTIRDKSNPKIREAINSYTKTYIDSMSKLKFDLARQKHKEAKESDKTIAEISMEESILQGQPVASQEFVDRKERSEAKKEEKIQTMAKERGLTVEQARTEYTAEYAGHRYKLTEQKFGTQGPIFRTDEHGGTIEVILNSDHAWYKKIYLDTKLPEAHRSAWKNLFFSMGEKAAEFDDTHQDFLLTYINNFSNRYMAALKKIDMSALDPDKEWEEVVNELDQNVDSEATLN